jgi:hypothetical protein
VPYQKSCLDSMVVSPIKTGTDWVLLVPASLDAAARMPAGTGGCFRVKSEGPRCWKYFLGSGFSMHPELWIHILQADLCVALYNLYCFT